MPAPTWSRSLVDPRGEGERAAAAAKKKRLSPQEQADAKEADELREKRYEQAAIARRREEDWAMRREVARQLAAEAPGSVPTPSFLARDAEREAREEAARRELERLEQASPSTFARTIGYAPASTGLPPIPPSAYERLAELGRPRTFKPVVASALPPHIEEQVQEASQRDVLTPPTMRSARVPSPMPAPVRESMRYATSPLPPPVHELVVPLTERAGPLSSTFTPGVPAAPSPADIVPPTIRDLTPPGSGRYRTMVNECSRRIVDQAIEASGGNKSEASRRLGITRQGLYKILDRRS